MAAASLDAPECAGLAGSPWAPNRAFGQMFFLVHQVRPAHQVHLVLRDVACRGDSHLGRPDSADASAALDAGHPVVAGYLGLFPAPVHDSPCALASVDVALVAEEAGSMAVLA